MGKLAELLLGCEPTISSSVEVKIRFSVSVEADSRSRVLAMMKAFVEAGLLGAFAVANAAPFESSVSMPQAPLFDALVFRQKLTVQNMDARAFQFLRHLLSTVPAKITQILVCSDDGSYGKSNTRSLPVITWENEDEEYPEPSKQIVFDVEWVELEGSKFRRALVEFDTPITSNQLKKLSQYVRVWGQLLENGAFALPSGLPSNTQSSMGMVTQFDEYAAEIEVPVYRASEVGWDALLRILETYHHREQPILRVQIE